MHTTTVLKIISLKSSCMKSLILKPYNFLKLIENTKQKYNLKISQCIIVTTKPEGDMTILDSLLF